MHQFVHDEGGTRHIAGVFHKGDEGIENQYLRQKDDDGSHASDDAVDQHSLQWTIIHRLAYPLTKPPYPCVYPVHGVLAEGKGHLEHQEKQEEEDRESQPAIGNECIQPMGGMIGIFLRTYPVASFLQGTAYKAVFGIHDGRFGISASLLLYTMYSHIASLDDGRSLRQLQDDFLGFLVFFKELQGQPPCTISQSQQIVAFQIFLNIRYTVFYLVSVVDMDMAIEVVVTLLTLKDMYHLAHQFLQSPTRLERRRHHRHTHQSAQRLYVEMVSATLSLVKHVQGADYPQVHIHQLGR